MRNRFILRFGGRFLTVAMLALSAVALHAQELQQQKIEFYLDGKIGAEVVKKGNYTLSYPDADQGTLEVKSGKKVISSAFTRKAIDIAPDADKMSYKDNSDGTRSIASIAPKGRKFILVLQ